MRITGKVFCHTSLRDSIYQNRRKGWNIGRWGRWRTVIAKRMKHGHRSWSRSGGNHLAKILAKKCSGKLNEVTERLRRPVFEEEKVEELYEEMLMAAKAPKKDGKEYEYPAIGHVVGLDGKIQGKSEMDVAHGRVLERKKVA